MLYLTVGMKLAFGMQPCVERCKSRKLCLGRLTRAKNRWGHLHRLGWPLRVIFQRAVRVVMTAGELSNTYFCFRRMMSNRFGLRIRMGDWRSNIQSWHLMIYPHSEDHCWKVVTNDCLFKLSLNFSVVHGIRWGNKFEGLYNLEIRKNKMRMKANVFFSLAFVRIFSPVF